MTEQIQGVSLNPDNFVEGGLIDDFDGIIQKARFVLFDFNGKSDERICILLEGVTKDGDAWSQYYSAGDPKRLTPSPDGTMAIPVGGSATSIVNSSNAAQLLTSVVNNGFPKDRLTRQITFLEGMGAHFRRVAQPERKGLKKKEDDQRENQTLVVEKIHWLPGETPKFQPGVAKTAATGVPAGVTSAAAGIPITPVAAGMPTSGAAAPADDKTQAYIIQLLSSNNGKINKQVLPQQLFQVCSKDPDSNKILTIAFSNDWLGNAARPWKFDANSGEISIGG